MLEILIWLESLDRAIFHFINTTMASPMTDFIMVNVTLDLHLRIFYGVCVILLLWKGDKRIRYAVLFSALALAISDQLSSAVLKPLFERQRPCQFMEVHLLVKCGSGFSLPSSHAANLFAQAYLFKGIAPKSTKYLIPLAIIVALSRVFVGVHFPGDVLIGAALGTIIGVSMASLFKMIIDKNIIKNKKEEKLFWR
ncbi:MAG: phosphatase PAP2 family protein [Candidatus Zixiibacteriota bacterium]